MTAVEWLIEQLEWDDSKIARVIGLKKYNQVVSQAKEMEKEQLECAWNSSDQNMRFQFSSSAYKAVTFKQWLEKFKQEKGL